MKEIKIRSMKISGDIYTVATMLATTFPSLPHEVLNVISRDDVVAAWILDSAAQEWSDNYLIRGIGKSEYYAPYNTLDRYGNVKFITPASKRSVTCHPEGDWAVFSIDFYCASRGSVVAASDVIENTLKHMQWSAADSKERKGGLLDSNNG